MKTQTPSDPFVITPADVLPENGVELILAAATAGLASENALDMRATGIEIEARGTEADAATKPRKFQMVAYTGGPMTVAAFHYPVVVDLEGIDAGNSARPILIDHDPSLDSVLGQTDGIEVKAGQLFVTGKVFGESERAKQVIALNDRGFKFQASIGASVQNREFVPEGSSAKVNGQTFNGPIHVARKTVLGEVSFVILGADDNTSARIAATAAKGTLMNFEQWLEAKGIAGDLSDAVRTVLKAQYDQEQAAKNKGGAAGQGAGANGNGANPGSGGGNAVTAGSRDLDSVIAPARKKDEQRKQIVDITARALQDNPDQIDMIQALASQAYEGEWDTQRYELELLRATRPQAQNRFRRSADEGVTNEMIEAAVCLTGGLQKPEDVYPEPVLHAAQKKWRHGMGLQELLHFFAHRNGHGNISPRDVNALLRAAFQEPPRTINASGISTLSLPNILSTVANRMLKQGFDQVESTWRSIAARRTVTDFRAVTSYSVTGDFTFIELAPDGQIKHGTIGETGYSNQAKTYARMFGIDRRDIINDDLNALTQVPRRIGRGGALKFNLVFWTTFMNNSAFWTAGNGTFLSGATAGPTDTRLNTDGLTLAETTFLGMTDPDGNPMAATPRILLVPNSLNVVASTLMRDANVMTTNANTTITTGNPHAGKFDVVRSSYLSNSAITGNSTTAWYLLADPNDVPVMEAAFLNGVETPTVEQADADFNQLGIQMRGYFDFGVSLQEYRGGVKMKGAA
jgi:phage major head subunit gpT-like protein